MKKTFKLDEIDCANCALKLEEALRRVDGVQEVKAVSYTHLDVYKRQVLRYTPVPP